MIRTILLVSWLTFLLGLLGTIFWYNDWIYRLPTPVPANYRHIKTGTKLDLSAQIHSSEGKPVFVHFYNPDCACSRFNKKHFQSLVYTYGKSAYFIVVVLSDKKFSQAYIQDKIGLQIPVLFDQSIAKRCGVYATPQAVLIDKDQKLYYRGNYNASRYCTEERTAYAKIALAGLLESAPVSEFEKPALKAYGCTIPVCNN